QWLSDRKKRALQKKDVDIQRRIELIQDFDMPTVSTAIKVSKDGQYILAAGTYKPRVRCYDTYQLSLKFERCLDSDVVTFDILSDDYSKLVFLHCNRYVEFHSQHGHYYKTRIPKFGRDFSYHYPSCDLYFVGARDPSGGGSDFHLSNMDLRLFILTLHAAQLPATLPGDAALSSDRSIPLSFMSLIESVFYVCLLILLVRPAAKRRRLPHKALPNFYLVFCKPVRRRPACNHIHRLRWVLSLTERCYALEQDRVAPLV
ncbi:UNVERIFIED_CONTAM: hypothetical protein FKN15_011622, partial [Acipenser sinensis]